MTPDEIKKKEKLYARVKAVEKAKIEVPVTGAHEYTDPILSDLPEEIRCQAEHICQHCPASLWYTTHNHLNCFCKATRTFSWTTQEPIPVTRCSGQIQAIAAMLAEAAAQQA